MLGRDATFNSFGLLCTLLESQMTYSNSRLKSSEEFAERYQLIDAPLMTL